MTLLEDFMSEVVMNGGERLWFVFCEVHLTPARTCTFVRLAGVFSMAKQSSVIQVPAFKCLTLLPEEAFFRPHLPLRELNRSNKRY